MGITYRRDTGEAAKAVLDSPYVEIYLATRAEPPYNGGSGLHAEDRFRDRTGAQTQRDGFTLVSAFEDGNLIGFGFGLSFDAGRWWGGTASPGPAEVVAAPKYAVIELNVAKPARGRGVGKTLLDTLLAERPEQYGILLANPDAPAHAMYLRWGLRRVGTVQSALDAPVNDALVLNRTGASRS